MRAAAAWAPDQGRPGRRVFVITDLADSAYAASHRPVTDHPHTSQP